MPCSNIEHTVQGNLAIDEMMLDLKKIFKEKWTKKRGDATKTLTGHTTDHFIDGVPIQKKKWDSRLDDIIDEETFKLITLPGYFNSLLDGFGRYRSGDCLRQDGFWRIRAECFQSCYGRQNLPDRLLRYADDDLDGAGEYQRRYAENLCCYARDSNTGYAFGME